MSALKVTSLQVNALTGNGTEVSPLNGSKNFTVSVRWPAGVASGAVVIETAPFVGYAGTWSNKTTFTIGSGSTAGTVDEWRGSGPFGAIRARIGTTVVSTGDGVSVELSEN